MVGPRQGVITSILAAHGSYALQLRLPEAVTLAVGRLGVFNFPRGEYLYLGSAFGTGGLQARLRHYLSSRSQPHWHLDYLRPHAQVTGGWYTDDATTHLECVWSQALARLPGCLVPAPGFGAADCRSGCAAHLLAFPAGVAVAQVAEILQFPGTRSIIIYRFSNGDLSSSRPG